MSKEREMVLLRTSDLIEEDSYGVHGSEFYRCKLCGGESGAGLLNKGITHDDACPLVVPPDPAIVGGELPAWLLVLIGEYGFAATLNHCPQGAAAVNDEELLDTIQDAIDGFPTISPEVWQAVKARIDRLARVEALADEWTKRGSKSSYDLNHRTNELRQALKGE